MGHLLNSKSYISESPKDTKQLVNSMSINVKMIFLTINSNRSRAMSKTHQFAPKRIHQKLSFPAKNITFSTVS